jgi:hypothetical protein
MRASQHRALSPPKAGVFQAAFVSKCLGATQQPYQRLGDPTSSTSFHVEDLSISGGPGHLRRCTRCSLRDVSVQCRTAASSVHCKFSLWRSNLSAWRVDALHMLGLACAGCNCSQTCNYLQSCWQLLSEPQMAVLLCCVLVSSLLGVLPNPHTAEQ